MKYFPCCPHPALCHIFLIGNMKTLLLLLLASGSALADDASLLRCRAIADLGQRFTCYEAIPVAQKTAPAVASAKAGAPGAAPVLAGAAAEQAFGKPVDKNALKSFDSVIPGKFEGLAPNQLITLANGQVWRIVDDSSAPVSGFNLKVKVERNFIGTTFMVIEGTNTSPKIKRVK